MTSPLNPQLFAVAMQLLGDLPADQRDAVVKIVPHLHNPSHPVHRKVDRALIQSAAEAVSDYSFSVTNLAEREAVLTALHGLDHWLTNVAPKPEVEADNG